MEIESSTLNPCAELGVLSKPDGSSEFSINNTIHMCAVYGPGEVKVSKELADKANVSITYKPRIGITTNREKELEFTIRSISDGLILTHLHPRTAISIIIQEIQNNGSYLANALNCTCLALLDANIPLKCSFAAVNCCLMSNDNLIIYFPNQNQESSSLITATFIFDSATRELISVYMNGLFDQDKFEYLLNNCREYAFSKIFPLFNELISKKYTKFA